MLLYNYYQLDKIQYQRFKEFLIKCSSEVRQPAHSNMNIHTLLNILDNTDRFKNGSFNILFDNEKVIACSGCYVSNFCSDILICGSRTWVDIDYRNRHIVREYLLPTEKQWAIDNKIKCIALTFNEYNKNMINLWFRRRFGEVRSHRKNLHFGYNGVNLVPHPVNIQYTKQWVIYEKLDKNFDFNWDDIRFTNVETIVP